MVAPLPQHRDATATTHRKDPKMTTPTVASKSRLAEFKDRMAAKDAAVIGEATKPATSAPTAQIAPPKATAEQIASRQAATAAAEQQASANRAAAHAESQRLAAAAAEKARRVELIAEVRRKAEISASWERAHATAEERFGIRTLNLAEAEAEAAAPIPDAPENHGWAKIHAELDARRNQW